MVIRKNFALGSLTLDVDAYERRLREFMEDEIKEAAKDWLSTVISIVPVWSRASHATFKPLADAVGFVIPTQPLVAKKDRSDLGESTSVGRLELEKTTFHFVYETNLQYLAFNEFNVASPGEGGVFSGLKTPTPFNFTGQAAEEFRKRTPELPDPFEFLRIGNL